jgi:RHS repeat-associated protein
LKRVSAPVSAKSSDGSDYTPSAFRPTASARKPLEAGAFGSPFTFTGELSDANGLVYLRARYYSPALGVFPSLDPVENLNRYQYVGANPVNWVDPSGMVSIPISLFNACNVSALILPFLMPTEPAQQDESNCGFAVGLGFENSEEIVRVLAAIGFQQNRFVGYRAMVLTVVAAMNLLDSGATVLVGLQSSQHPYSHAGCDTVQLDACIDANKAVGIAFDQRRRNEITEEELQNLINERDRICSSVNRAELLACVSGYFDWALEGGETYPSDSGNLAHQILFATRRLIAGRCNHGDSSYYFRGGWASLLGQPPELADQIADTDANNNISHVVSFDSSWLDEIETWKECYKKNNDGRALNCIAVPPDVTSENQSRAVLIADDWNPLCAYWQDPKEGNPAYTNPALCNCDFTG